MGRKKNPEYHAKEAKKLEEHKAKTKASQQRRNKTKIEEFEAFTEIVTNPNGTKRIRILPGAPPIPPTWKNPYPTDPSAAAYKHERYCGQEKSGKSSAGGGVCTQKAGWGTNHSGWGWCKWHGGNTPTGNIHAAKQMMQENMPMYGDPIDITPGEALLQEVQRTAGHVEWLRQMINSIGDTMEDEQSLDKTLTTAKPPKVLAQTTEAGQMASVWLSLYQQERKHLIHAAKMALDAGVAERQVRIAEEQGMILANVIRTILSDKRLSLTPEQQVATKDVVREALMAVTPALNAGPTTVDADGYETEKVRT